MNLKRLCCCRPVFRSTHRPYTCIEEEWISQPIRALSLIVSWQTPKWPPALVCDKSGRVAIPNRIGHVPGMESPLVPTARNTTIPSMKGAELSAASNDQPYPRRMGSSVRRDDGMGYSRCGHVADATLRGECTFMWSAILAALGLPLTALWWIVLNVVAVGCSNLGFEFGRSSAFDTIARVGFVVVGYIQWFVLLPRLLRYRTRGRAPS